QSAGRGEFGQHNADPLGNLARQLHARRVRNRSKVILGATFSRASSAELGEVGSERFYSLNIPSSFIYCRQDRALPAGYFHARMSSRLGSFKLVEMDGSHEVMFTRQAELAEKIVEASD